jgi:hypothetical protein
VFPVRYKLDFYIPKEGILHSHRRENLKSYKIYSSLFNYSPSYKIQAVSVPNIKNCGIILRSAGP